MLSNIWSKLPNDLISCVIEQTDDVTTLKDWCTATIGNSNLYHSAIRNRWAELTLDHADLLPKAFKKDQNLRKKIESAVDRQVQLLPVEEHDVAAEKQAKEELRQAGHVGVRWRKNHLRYVIKDHHGLVPAAFVKRLYLNFTFMFMYQMHSDNAEVFREALPSLRTLCHSLSLLFPLLTQVEEITVDGAAPQPVLDAITGLKSPRLHVLKYRITECRGYFREKPPNYPSSMRLVTWETSSRLQSLRVLEIQQLRNDEARSLAEAVATLLQLERLMVASGQFSGLDWSPLAVFLEHVLPRSSSTILLGLQKGSAIGFPSTLKSLVLIDNHSR